MWEKFTECTPEFGPRKTFKAGVALSWRACVYTYVQLRAASERGLTDNCYIPNYYYTISPSTSLHAVRFTQRRTLGKTILTDSHLFTVTQRAAVISLGRSHSV